MSISTKFIIFGQGRTGSKLLHSLLRSHPDICCEGELLRKGLWPRYMRPLWWFCRRRPLPYLNYRVKRAEVAAGGCAYGLKLFPSHLQRPERSVHLLNKNGWLFIHLKRRSIFDQTLSYAVADRTGIYGRKPGTLPPSVKITIDKGLFQSMLSRLYQESKLMDELLDAIPHLDIVYEDDLRDSSCWCNTGARIAVFLSLPPAPVTSPVVRQWPWSYEKIISNHAELVEAYQEMDLSRPSRAPISCLRADHTN